VTGKVRLQLTLFETIIDGAPKTTLRSLFLLYHRQMRKFRGAGRNVRMADKPTK